MIFDVAVVDNFNRANGVISSPWSSFGTSHSLSIENTSVLWNGALSSGWFGAAVDSTVSDLHMVAGYTLANTTPGTWGLLARAQNIGTGSARAYCAECFISGGSLTSKWIGILEANGTITNQQTFGGGSFPVAIGDKLAIAVYDNDVQSARVSAHLYTNSTSTWTQLLAYGASGQYYLSNAGPAGISLRVNTGGQHQQLDDWFVSDITPPTSLDSDLIQNFSGPKIIDLGRRRTMDYTEQSYKKGRAINNLIRASVIGRPIPTPAGGRSKSGKVSVF